MQTDTQATRPPRVTVRGIPASGFTGFWCAKRKWGKDPVTVEIVDVVMDPATQITPADYARLTDPGVSQHIAVTPFGEENSAEAMTLRKQLADATAETAKLRKELSEFAEISARERQVADKLAAEAGGKVVALTAEVERLQAELRRAVEKRGKVQ